MQSGDTVKTQERKHKETSRDQSARKLQEKLTCLIKLPSHCLTATNMTKRIFCNCFKLNFKVL